MRHTAAGAAVERKTERCQSAAGAIYVVIVPYVIVSNVNVFSVPRVGAGNDLRGRCSIVVQLSGLLA